MSLVVQTPSFNKNEIKPGYFITVKTQGGKVYNGIIVSVTSEDLRYRVGEDSYVKSLMIEEVTGEGKAEFKVAPSLRAFEMDNMIQQIDIEEGMGLYSNSFEATTVKPDMFFGKVTINGRSYTAKGQ